MGVGDGIDMCVGMLYLPIQGQTRGDPLRGGGWGTCPSPLVKPWEFEVGFLQPCTVFLKLCTLGNSHDQKYWRIGDYGCVCELFRQRKTMP